ncbi:MAG: hypothetical protein N3G22_00415 [Candidatus Micrarchaeota archaeon]|nr:hypothetical protein [Candidatus Micrarchaeota archaeon]
MLVESKKKKGFFEETNNELASLFAEAGAGFSFQKQFLFHPLEAAYFVKIGKAAFKDFKTFESFLSRWRQKDPSFPFAFSVYFAIRQTGRLIYPYMKKTNFFRVYSPGVGRQDSRPSQLVCLLPGKFPSQKTLENEVRVAHLARLDLIVACGTPQNIRFYKISSFNF